MSVFALLYQPKFIVEHSFWLPLTSLGAQLRQNRSPAHVDSRLLKVPGKWKMPSSAEDSMLCSTRSSSHVDCDGLNSQSGETGSRLSRYNDQSSDQFLVSMQHQVQQRLTPDVTGVEISPIEHCLRHSLSSGNVAITQHRQLLQNLGPSLVQVTPQLLCSH